MCWPKRCEMDLDDDVRAMSPLPFETLHFRSLINQPVAVPTTHTQPTHTLDLSGFSQFHQSSDIVAVAGAHASALMPPPPPPKRHCASLPLTPPLPQSTRAHPLSPESPPNAVRALPGIRHAGLLSQYGGLKRFMQMQRGERPWQA